MKSCSVFHIEQKMEFKKFNCFFVNFLRYTFGLIKFISTMIEREYTPDITRQICFAYQWTGFYMIRGFAEWYFLTNCSYILEKHFYFVKAPDYCFESFLFRIFCVNCLLDTKVLQLIHFPHHCFARSSFRERKK